MKIHFTKFPIGGLLLLLFLSLSGVKTHAQAPIVSYQVAKESPETREFLVVWESPDYKGTLAQLEQLFRGDERVISEQYLWKLHQISVLTSREMSAQSFATLLKDEGFEVREKTAAPKPQESGKN